MQTTSSEVVARAAQVAETAREGAAWLTHNRPPTDAKDDPVAQSFRRLARRANRLRIAADRPTCVAVFGASQAGKSYLVSSLATQQGRPLLATYGAQTLNFLRDMNPQGEKEATGLVTRFTLAPIPSSPQLPVALRLLSQTDVVKILANAFLEDFKLDDLNPIDGTALTKLFDGLSGAAAPGPQSGMTIDDIEEMREYFSLHFRTHPMLQELGSAYWAHAADIIPRLPPSRRAEAYAPLWNNTPAFTRLAGKLIGGLENIGFPDTAFCGLDALMPRELGVLNADTVFAVAEGDRGQVRVQGTGGASAMMDRALLAAVIAELTVPLADKPWDFLEHTDLLDFPGARSREVIRSLSFLDEPGSLGRVFLRGKVAYLFQRYNTEQEIAAMLLCVGPSNQDVQTLPEMIDAWVGQTIGVTPEARAKQRNSLFVVLTKFDSEFVEKEGEDVASGQRWTTRLQASLLDFFGKAYDWPRNWTPGRPFDNCFWLRSTAVRFNAAFDYIEPVSEGGPRSETLAQRAEPFLSPRRTAYLSNTSVQEHFLDPARAWAEAMRENDGGIGYLAERLRPTCDPMLKVQQISGRLQELAVDISTQLRPHFHDGDLAAELERTRASARALLVDLLACAKVQRFGALIRALQVTSDQITSVYWRLQSGADDTPTPIGTVSRDEDYGDLGELLGEPAPSGPAAARDRFERFAELAIEDWTRGMQTFAESHEAETIYRISRERAQVLTGEIARAARRLDLRGRATRALHTHASFQNRSASVGQKPVIVVEQTINDFVYMLGFDTVAPERRPKTPNGSRLIFAPRPPVNGLPSIGAQPTPYDSRFHVDWMTAIVRTMEDNVQDASSGRIDVEQNALLGRLLQSLS